MQVTLAEYTLGAGMTGDLAGISLSEFEQTVQQSLRDNGIADANVFNAQIIAGTVVVTLITAALAPVIFTSALAVGALIAGVAIGITLIGTAVINANTKEIVSNDRQKIADTRKQIDDAVARGDIPAIVGQQMHNILDNELMNDDNLGEPFYKEFLDNFKALTGVDISGVITNLIWIVALIAGAFVVKELS